MTERIIATNAVNKIIKVIDEKNRRMKYVLENLSTGARRDVVAPYPDNPKHRIWHEL